ncbi:hypothetical protein MAR_007658 [Mya arenaria]|uniref:Uncharacterized protein n=1 Tax=Mya arenaria TaxID=6604 RepID=A0ABY7DTS1_MYAAR|nr:hypothetical protein MAR_007658 [Mya arenaria]
MATPQKIKRKENWSRAEHEMLRNKSIIFGAAPYCQNSYMCIACSGVMSIYLQSVSWNVPGGCHDSKKYNTNCSKSDKSLHDSIYKQLEKTS